MPLPDRLPYLWPTELRLSGSEAAQSAPKKWIQIAKTGKFFSTRYGKFEISRTDLSSMLSNFKNITPQHPTQLPVDYDHISMDPKKPGDGIAAGWFTGPMELRDGGDTLWAEVEFTPKAAAHIRDKEYRFISPSFTKNHVFKDGTNIGTTLLAAAITNMPFLEGMDAITLSNHLGELAVQLSAGGSMDIGQMVSIKPSVMPGGPGMLAGKNFEIVQVAGTGADAFAQLKDPTTGTVTPGWFRVSDLAPAAAADPAVNPANPAVPATPAAPATPHANPFATHMSEGQMPGVISLRTVAGTTVEVKSDEMQKFLDDQIAAAAEAKVKALVPEGSVVIAASKLGEFEATASTVTSLRAEVTDLREKNDQAAREAHVTFVTQQLTQLSGAAKITKPERDHLIKTYSDPISLAAFNEYLPILQARPSLVNLRTVGSGETIDAPTGERADADLSALAAQMAKDEKIPFRDAVKRVSAQRVDLSTKYRDNIADLKDMRRSDRERIN